MQEANWEICYAFNEDSSVKHIEELPFIPQWSNTNTFLKQDLYRQNLESNKALPDKVIIFSQFLEHIHVIEQQVAVFSHFVGMPFCGLFHRQWITNCSSFWQLTVAGIKFAGMYSPMHSSNKVLCPQFPATSLFFFNFFFFCSKLICFFFNR